MKIYIYIKMKNSNLISIFITSISFIFINCGNQPVHKFDIVGLWESKDGAKIEIKENGNYIANNINYYNYDSKPEYKNKKFSFSGIWKLESNNKNITKLKLESNKTFKDFGINSFGTINGTIEYYKISISFEIQGEGIFKNKPPFFLFVWIGDPDDINQYKFVKK